MAESWIKVKATYNEISKDFKECPSDYYYIRNLESEKEYNGNADEPIIFNVLIRHCELGGKKLRQNKPYILKSLDKVLRKMSKEFENKKLQQNEEIKCNENNNQEEEEEETL